MPIPSFSQEKLDEMKQQFQGLLRETQREGIEDLLAYMDTTDFYTAPASTQHHGAIYGGLIRHSLKVYQYLQNFLKPLGEKSPPQDSIAIAGLLHDLCKANFYKLGRRNVKNEIGQWEEVEYFTIEDQFPLGHGEKSMFLVERYIKLTDEEALAIRWHMGGYDDAARAFAGGKAQSNAYDQAILAPALNIADMYVSRILQD